MYVKQAFAIGHEILEECDLINKVSLVYDDYNTYLNSDKIIKMIHYINTKDEITKSDQIVKTIT